MFIFDVSVVLTLVVVDEGDFFSTVSKMKITRF